MKKRFNKRGSIMVFLTSILITMIMLSFVFVQAARSVCGASYSDAVLELAGRSVLAEFDRRLKDEYGVFAFYGLENIVESKIMFYANGSFNKRLPGELMLGNGLIIDVFKLKLQRVDASLTAHSLMDVDMLEEQIEDYMKYLMVQKGLKFIEDMWSGVGGAKSNPSGADRELKNRAEINSLPSFGNVSNGIDISAIVSKGIPSISEIFDESTSRFMVNEYIMSHFQYNIGGGKQKETFFRNEVEYILYGKMKDKDNLSKFRNDFLLLRTALNMAHIMADQKKRSTAMALAEPFGPFAPAAFTAIVAAWGAAEAENDARRLLDGKKVAFIKTEATWALGLKAAVRARSIRNDEGDIVGVSATPRKVKGYISPVSNSGMSYAEYLRVFLFLEKRETKLLRVMDLIQLNLRGSYYEGFLIKDHYTGFSLEAVVSGKKFEYEQKY